MCVVSAVTQNIWEDWEKRINPWKPGRVEPMIPGTVPLPYIPEKPITLPEVIKAQELIKKAKEFDKVSDQAHCEEEAKIKALTETIKKIKQTAEKDIKKALDDFLKEIMEG